MSKTDLVKALGVEINSADYIAASLRRGASMYNEYVSVQSLQSALEKLPVVYGISDDQGMEFSNEKSNGDTHQARILAIEEIKRESTKVEKTVIFPENYKAYDVNGNEFGSLFAGKKVKMILEEVQS